MARFVIRRKDLYSDDLIIESDSLTVGSALDNDLLLNHPTVSRTHAGIREFDGKFWITNLSKSNGTLVNGTLVETVQLQANDTIQIGVFLIRLDIDTLQLVLKIERQIDSVAAGNRATSLLGTPLQAAAEGKTVFFNSALVDFFKGQATTQLPVQKNQTNEDIAKLNTTGLQRGLTGLLNSIFLLPEAERKRFQESIDVFWERRKQVSEGSQKLEDKSVLHPTTPDPELIEYNLHLGKKRYNWLPTNDLVRLWPRGYLYIGGIVVILASAIGVFAWQQIYSPGIVSNPHRLSLIQQSSEITSRIGNQLIANNVVQNNCASCHSIASSMQAKCVDCHTTAHFNPNVIDKHQSVGLECVNCHTEHKGAAFRPALVARSICIDCHRDGSNHPKAKKLDGDPLAFPHGGTLGYPVVDGKWLWKNPLNKKWTFPDTFGPKEKFHLIHIASSVPQSFKCSACHTSFSTPEKITAIDQMKCAVCHQMKFIANSNSKPNKENLDKLAAVANLDCNTCHPQHGADSMVLASLKSTGANKNPIPYTPSGVYRGGKDWQWTSFASTFGGLSVQGWGIFFSLIPITITGFFAFDSVRRRRIQTLLKGKIIELSQSRKSFADTRYADHWESSVQKERAKISAESFSFPHPVINYETCIGCHACILACPQDVLGFDDQEHHAIVVNYEQCMEDTSCQVACPTVPQSCIVINTKRVIREAPKPLRKGGNEGFEAEGIGGIYLIGDVSGVPLIRNAIKEGRLAIEKIAEKFEITGKPENTDYDVAIIGVGPAGISATATAAKLGLKYIALEQSHKYSTIVDKYPANKYVAFNPFNPSDPLIGDVKLEGPGDFKENMLAWWDDAVTKLNLKINEYEGCREISKEQQYFLVKTVKNQIGYKVATVVLAIGNSGEPRKLGCLGEVDERVEYRLQDPSSYKNIDIVVVGAGNSAIEAAIDLVGKRQSDGTVLFPDNMGNRVTLVIRSDFPKDLTLENKMWIYYCIDKGRVKVFWGAGIKEILENEVIIENIRSKSVLATISNDLVFALIGSVAPKELLLKVGIKYTS